MNCFFDFGFSFVFFRWRECFVGMWEIDEGIGCCFIVEFMLKVSVRVM